MKAEPVLTYEYHVGGTLLADDPTYVKRQADDDFYKALKVGNFCYVFSSRQMGKSSLKVRTMKRLQAEGCACVAIDLTGIGSSNTTSTQWYASIIRNIAGSLSLNFDLRTWLREQDFLLPVQRFRKFLENILFVNVSESIIIFIDEIESTLKLEFKDDFFALIRFCYNQRAINPEYNRLTFAILGVGTSSALIQNREQTPFNIGTAINLQGLQLAEAQPLVMGLAEKFDNPQKILKAILDWTGGQPFLTQKLCKLAVEDTLRDCDQSLIKNQHEIEWVKQLVTSKIIQNWESQDEPKHLRTIRDRILSNERRTVKLLGLYQQILQGDEITANDSLEQIELRLSGLVVNREGKLNVYNPIYKEIFNQDWINNELINIRSEINFLVKFLWFCSGANISVLKKCQVDHDKYAAIGFTILLTAILASVSGGYALWTVFNSQAMATLFGGFWGLMIGSLDRFLVSTTRKEEHWSFQQIAFITIRVSVAIFIALVVAKPLEIKIFEKPIRAKLVEENFLQLIKAYSEIEDKEKANQALEKELDILKQQRDKKSQEVICEIDGTCGTTKVGHGPAFREKQKELNVISQEYEKKKQDSEKQINENRQRIAELTKKRDFELAEIDNEREKADDIMTQLEILDKLENKKTFYSKTTFYITLLFVLINVSPILAKMLLKRSLYDIALEKEEEKQLNVYSRSLSISENYSLQKLEITEQVRALETLRETTLQALTETCNQYLTRDKAAPRADTAKFLLQKKEELTYELDTIFEGFMKLLKDKYQIMDEENNPLFRQICQDRLEKDINDFVELQNKLIDKFQRLVDEEINY